MIENIRCHAFGGDPLEDVTRRRLQEGFGVDLSAIRIHHDRVSDRLTRALGTDAFACGTHLFFLGGAYAPRTEAGFALLAHEVTHAVQQESGAQGPEAESEAEQAARDACRGRPVQMTARATPRADRLPTIVQRHESFEHRSLGDMRTADITAVGLQGDPKLRDQILERETGLMWKWHQDPEKVSEKDIADSCPWIRTLRLPSTGLLVTYGELNALPDYIASAQAIDTCPKPVLLSLLQSIRQETFVRLNALRNQTKKDRFANAPFGPDDWQSGLLNKVFNTWALDDLTRDLGINGIDHYSGLLARNACHFAPFSWYRWQAAYLIAVDLAKKSHAAGERGQGRLAVQALTYHGYADHFLQDSFAAGHLVNKTLVMQWFVKWAATSNLYIEDWNLFRDVTVALQPALAGRKLYAPTYAGPGTDPQTVEEQATYADRLALSGVVAYTDPDKKAVDRDTAYQHYLTFLSSLITQLSCNAVHDAFNEKSLMVSSENHRTPYQVYGDDSLFTGKNGSDGATITSESAHLSQQSVDELLNTGTTQITVDDIRRSFPTRVWDGKTMNTIEAWATGLEDWAIREVFNSSEFLLKRLGSQLSPRVINFSKDQAFANTWYTDLDNAGWSYADTVLAGDRLFAASNGLAYELRPNNGKVVGVKTIPDASGETHIATNGSMLFAGNAGYVSALQLNPSLSPAWKTPLTGLRSLPVRVLYAGGRLFAGSNGAVHEIDPEKGTRLRSLDVSSASGQNVHLATDGKMLFAGCHGYAYGISLNDWSKVAWTCPMTDASYSNVEVLFDRGMLLAGSNGSVHQVDPGTGKRLHSVGLSAAVDEEVRMTLTDQPILVAGCHGWATGIRLSDWSKGWETPMAGKLYDMVDVAAYGSKVYAVSNGYAQRLDVATGKVLNVLLLGHMAGSGDYTPSLTLSAKWGLTVGMHGYVYNLGL